MPEQQVLKGYKAVYQADNKKLFSWLTNLSSDVSRGLDHRHTVEYKVDEWVYPHDPTFPLFVLKETALEDELISYIFEHVKIFECEYILHNKRPTTIASPCRHWSNKIGFKQSIEIFWKTSKLPGIQCIKVKDC